MLINLSLNKYYCMIEVARENHVDLIYEILKKSDEEGYFFRTLDENDEENIIDKEKIRKDIKNKNRIVLINNDRGKINGYSLWIALRNEDQTVYYNMFTYVLPEARGNGTARMFYYYFLNKSYPVFAEFVLTDFFDKIWKIWEEKGTKLIGFVPNMYLINSKGNLFTSILGGRINNESSRIKILPEYKEYTNKLCRLYSLECTIETINEEFKLIRRKGILKIGYDAYEGIKNGYIIAGILPLKYPLYIFTGDVDKKALDIIRSKLKKLDNPEYMDLFWAYENSILEYVSR